MNLPVYGIIGLGITGKAMAKFLLKKNDQVIGFDDHFEKIKEDPELLLLCQKGLVITSDLRFIQTVSILIVSSGVSFSHPCFQMAKESNVSITSEIEIAASLFKKKAVGITGTNGKTTITKMTEHFLQKAGYQAKAFGNVGLPLIEAIEDDLVEIAVVELSSYQLDSLKTPFLDHALIINITPDHLDRYQTFQDYERSKWSIFDFVKTQGNCFIHEKILKKEVAKDKSLQFGHLSSSDFYIEENVLFENGKKIGAIPENLQDKQGFFKENFLAAYLLCRSLQVPPESIFFHYSSFRYLPHRLEYVKEYQGIQFYNDSKGTTVEATEAAVSSFKKPIFLLAGGEPKKQDFSSWKISLKEKVKHLFVFGKAKEKIIKDLEGQIPITKCDFLLEAFSLSLHLAKEGDVVLLSPGCASFDQYPNYQYRGEEFRKAVMDLEILKKT